MITINVLRCVRALSKIFMVSILALGVVSQVHAAGVWFKGVTVTRVMTGEEYIQISGDKGCSSSGYPSQYITTLYSTDTAFISRLMNLASMAQASGKTLSFYADCGIGTIEQLCVNEPALDTASC